jgi:hypothetical protein
LEIIHAHGFELHQYRGLELSWPLAANHERLYDLRAHHASVSRPAESLEFGHLTALVLDGMDLTDISNLQR